jgi:VanZ family protein
MTAAAPAAAAEGRKRLLRILWGLAILAVIVGSLLPGDSTPIQMLGHLDVSDKIQHFGAYAVLTFLPAIHERRKFVLRAALFAIALGIGLEFGQLESPGRDFEVGDMVADALGVCLGLIVGVPLRASGLVRTLLCASSQ